MMGNPFDIHDRVALVTGASSGLGRRFAEVLAEAGARVALAARRLDRLEALAADINVRDRRALAVEMDVTDRESVKRALARAETELGPLAIVVNNAGIAVPRSALAETEEDWGATLETNLTGAWRVAQEVARLMALHRNGGCIVNIASIAALRASQSVTAYSAAKAGLVSMTRSMANEFARYDIRVNALAPGYFSTDLNSAYLRSEAGEELRERVPQRRFGELSDLDGPLLLLASDAGRYMTGAVVVVDGGHSINML